MKLLCNKFCSRKFLFSYIAVVFGANFIAFLLGDIIIWRFLTERLYDEYKSVKLIYQFIGFFNSLIIPFLIPIVIGFLYIRSILKNINSTDENKYDIGIKKIFNAPIKFGLISLFGWIIGFAGFLLNRIIFHQLIKTKVPIFAVFLNVIFMGIFCFVLSFYILGYLNRRYFIPKLNIKKKLSEYKGIINLSVKHKFKLYFFATSFLPIFFILTGVMHQRIKIQDPEYVSIIKFAGAVSVVFILLGLFITRLISNSFGKPLVELKDVATNIKNGNYNQTIQIVSSDEFGHLGEAINLMSTQLNCYISKINEMNKNLELKVEERTKELKNTLYALEEKDKIISEDLSMAKKIQSNLLSVKYHEMFDFNISIYYKPMIEVGGDIYDINKVRSDYFRIFIADATGHGIQASLTTMIIKSEYDKIKFQDVEPNNLLKNLNSTFNYYYTNLNVFFTCMIADIDLKHNKIKYSSAGHPSQILIHNDEVKLIKTGGKMIGVIDSFEYINLEDDFLSNSKLLLFTDGVFEEFSENGEELGEDGLIKIVENNIDKPITELTNCIVKSVNDFIEGSFINDDITIIGLELK